MSEFQYYQFQTIDRRLTKDDREYLQTKSSRVQLETHGARFVYAYGDFRGDPLETLDRCFDMMLYIANFGARTLAFRFPKDAIDPEIFDPYKIEYAVKVKPTKKSILLELSFYGLDFVTGWIDDREDMLSPLIPLYQDIINGDLSLLYLTWRRIETSEEMERPDGGMQFSAPPTLKKPSPELQAYADFIDLDLESL
ncbi:hypothetical protein [Baaleninema simplex]|uniref:hypothetical protein n=1 Tax=Baaleninema simplex TaxID=2862350 RepID=UPI0003451680|nr:hypothetical protein [Baaleninema simplex]